jgi:CheY-like chemotaxis protein
VEVAVSDTGIGIGEAARDRLFDAFYQESSGLNREHEGCGLGLAITKQLVDMMRGEIEVASEKGGGTTFRFRLPRAADDPSAYSGQSTHEGRHTLPAPAQDSEAPRRPSRRSSQPSVLVVEDNEATRHFIQQVLEESHESQFATTASEALALARQATFDVVLLDINLGSGQSGEDVLRELRRMDAYRETPVVAVTAHALPDDEERFLTSGFDGYLSKPFSARHLKDVLETVEPVGSRRSGSEGRAVRESHEGLPLEDLLKTCRTHELIDGYEWNGERVTLSIDIASFRLTPEDARVVLLTRLQQRDAG